MSRSYARSEQYYRDACEVLPGGVNSNFRLHGQPVPLVFERGVAAHLIDLDGNDYVDYALGMGPNILGHAPEPVIRAVADTLAQGQIFAGQHPAEAVLARRVQELVPCAELVRFGVAGSEMVQAALRLARAFTGRPTIVKFEGHYHGWFDTILVSVAPPLADAGPEDAPRPFLPSAGQSVSASHDVVVLPWNNLPVLERYLAEHAADVAGIIMEPILCNTSVMLPLDGYLEGVRRLCDAYGIVLIFDEVITGFRVGLHSAQGLLGVTPDLAVFAKSLAGGFPIGAFAGRRDIMHLAAGSVLHGGSFNGHIASVAAALATLAELSKPGVYAAMTARGEALMEGLRTVAFRHDVPLLVQGLGTVFNTSFSHGPPVTSYREYAAQCDLSRLPVFLHGLQENGVRPTSRGTWFLSTAHTDQDIEQTIQAAERALTA